MAEDDVVDNELLALADDSESEGEVTKPVARDGRSSSPKNQSMSTKPTTSIRRPSPKKRPSTSRRRRDEPSEDGEETSDVDSDGAASGHGALPDRHAAPRPMSPQYPVDGTYRDQAEKAKVGAMAEIDREEFLAARAEEKRQLEQSNALKSYVQGRTQPQTAAPADKAEKKRKADIVEPEDTPRKRNTAKARQSDAIAGYKRNRERVQEERKRGEGHNNLREDRSSEEEARFSDRDADAESDVEWDDKPRAAPQRDEPPAQLRDFQRVRVGRTNFAKVCYYPGFEDAVRGCFCRVAIGLNRQTGENQYRMTQIKGFTTGREYQMEYSQRPFRCNLYAILAHGKAEKEWPFTACSDSLLTESEFDRYRETLYAENARPPSASHLATKCSDVQALIDHRWSEDEITEKLRRQGWLSSQRAEADRERILAERARAISDGDESTIARLDAELAALEGPKPALSSGAAANAHHAYGTPSKAPTQQERLAAINRANRKTNTEEIRRAQIAERKRNAQLQSAIGRGEAVPDAFARVKTKPKTHYNAREAPRSGGAEDLFGDEGVSSAPAANGGAAAAAAAAAKPSRSKKKVLDDEVLAAMDIGIDIEI